MSNRLHTAQTDTIRELFALVSLINLLASLLKTSHLSLVFFFSPGILCRTCWDEPDVAWIPRS